jgi:hypothetical protein
LAIQSNKGFGKIPGVQGQPSDHQFFIDVLLWVRLKMADGISSQMLMVESENMEK